MNAWVFNWLSKNTLVWRYTGDGGLLGLLDYERLEKAFYVQDLKLDKRFLQMFQEIEKGAKHQRDKMLNDQINKAKSNRKK